MPGAWRMPRIQALPPVAICLFRRDPPRRRHTRWTPCHAQGSTAARSSCGGFYWINIRQRGRGTDQWRRSCGRVKQILFSGVVCGPLASRTTNRLQVKSFADWRTVSQVNRKLCAEWIHWATPFWSFLQLAWKEFWYVLAIVAVL